MCAVISQGVIGAVIYAISTFEVGMSMSIK
jgi:hypothetical protein